MTVIIHLAKAGCFGAGIGASVYGYNELAERGYLGANAGFFTSSAKHTSLAVALPPAVIGATSFAILKDRVYFAKSTSISISVVAILGLSTLGIYNSLQDGLYKVEKALERRNE